MTISWQTCAAAFSTPASSPDAALSHRLVSLALASAEMFGAEAMRDLHAATAAFTVGLFASEDPPVGVEEAADAVALLEDDAAVVLEEAAGAEDDVAELDEEELLPHPPMRAATASSAESFLIMGDTLVIRAATFSVV